MQNNPTNEKLLVEIEQLKKELKKKKKYGLVWEDKPEDVVEMCKEKLPVLKEVKSKEIITDENKPMNLLIEGDNYHALSVLNYTHKGKIDVIYIDPPYNTGNKDFIFNDHYIDREDGFRHSKWLNFMEKRLKLSQKLLNNSGFIFISIDDHEQAPLKMLCDEIFREENFVANITIQGSANESNEGVMFQDVTEYLLCYAKNISVAKINKIDAVNEDWRSLNDAPSGLSTRKQMGYTIYYNTKTQDIIPKIDYDTNGDFSNLDNIYIDDKELLRNGYIAIRPKARNGVAWRWRWGMETLIERKSELKFRQNRNGDWVVEFGQSGFNAPRDYQEFGTGTTELKKIFDGKEMFNKPKSTELIKWILEVGASKSAVILDFFAGSGTTGHAVLSQNKEDGGNRKFILCTDNQDNNGSGLKIAEDICYPRVKKVIEGYKNSKGEKVTGLGGNLKYFKTDFVDYKESTDGNKIKLTKEAVEMLCVKEGTFESVLNNEDFKIFKNHDHYAGIIFDQLVIEDFKKAIKEIKGKISVYIFSLGDDSFEDEFEDIKQKVKLSPIPEAILKVYRRIYK